MRRILLLPAMLICGCYFSKTKDDIPWNPDAASGIRPGVTTRAEVLQRLGPPTEVVELLDSDAYIYRRFEEKTTGGFFVLLVTQRVDRQYDGITVIIDRKGIVAAIGTRFSSGLASYGTPWGD